MPKEQFWNPAATTSDGGAVLTVEWDADSTGVRLNGVEFDAKQIERLANVLRRSISKDRVVTVTLKADVAEYLKAMEAAAAATRKLRDEMRGGDIEASDE